MATWTEFENEAPELAAAVRAKFEGEKHHVLATLRADGSPRVSGTEVEFRGEALVIGSMWQARKAQDLLRDPRFAIHANPGRGTEMAGGDAKVSGRAVEVARDEGASHTFELHLDEAVLITVAGDHLDIDLWRPGQGVRRTARA